MSSSLKNPPVSSEKKAAAPRPQPREAQGAAPRAKQPAPPVKSAPPRSPPSKAATEHAPPPKPPPPQPAAEQTPPAAEAAETQQGSEPSVALAGLLNPSWLISTIVHVIILLILALITLPAIVEELKVEIVSTFDQQEIEHSEILLEEFSEIPEAVEASAAATTDSTSTDVSSFAEMTPSTTELLTSNNDSLDSVQVGELSPLASAGMPATSDLLQETYGQLMGTQARGNVAVVFDVTASMYVSVPLVVEELKRKFDDAHVVVVHGATFKPYGTGKFMPYARNTGVHKYMYDNTVKWTKNKLPQLKVLHESLLSLKRCDSLAPEGLLQSLGAALVGLLNMRTNRPDTIFVFSDFQDGIDPDFMQKVAAFAAKEKVRIVVFHPGRFTKDRAAYLAFATATGGELREGLAKAQAAEKEEDY